MIRIKPICEVMVKDILPGARAMVARTLVEKHGFSQKIAAERLGTTQPAISLYKCDLRGKNRAFRKNPNLANMLDSIAKRAASGELSHDMVTEEFCKLCRYMRKSGLACEFHRRMYPSLENCRICMDED